MRSKKALIWLKYKWFAILNWICILTAFIMIAIQVLCTIHFQLPTAFSWSKKCKTIFEILYVADCLESYEGSLECKTWIIKGFILPLMHSKGLEFILNVSEHTSILRVFIPQTHIFSEWFFTHSTLSGHEIYKIGDETNSLWV